MNLDFAFLQNKQFFQNTLHSQFRYRYPTVQLAELYLRSTIYNAWQFYRNQQMLIGIKEKLLTLYHYKKHMISRIESEIVSNVICKLKYLQKRKRKLYFGI